MRILVVGATGMLGRPVARRLAADGYEVRALSRDPRRARALLGDRVAIVEGDVARQDSLYAAMDGCRGVHINLRGGNTVESYERNELAGTENIASLARSLGVKLLTYVGGAGDPHKAAGFPLAHVKAGAIDALVNSGVAYTIFQPTHFMESLANFIHAGRATVIGHQPHRYHYLAADDFAAMVSRAFQVEGSRNNFLTVFGPEAFTMEDALTKYCAVRHPDLKVGTVPLWLFRLLAAVKRDQDMKFAAMLFAGFSKIGEGGDPREANALLGAPTTTLDQWLAERT